MVPICVCDDAELVQFLIGNLINFPVDRFSVQHPLYQIKTVAVFETIIIPYMNYYLNKYTGNDYNLFYGYLVLLVRGHRVDNVHFLI